MKLSDVRRLTGANLLMDRPGAAGELELPTEKVGLVVGIWRHQMGQLLDAVAWPSQITAARIHGAGASVAISAPIDALYIACDMVEWAWAATLALVNEGRPPDLQSAAAEFGQRIAADANPQLRELAEASRARGVTLLEDADALSLGLGTGVKSWHVTALPNSDALNWDDIHDVPVALVTGTNGKSTTVRLTAAIGTEAGKTVGLSSSDWVRVGDEIIDEGDYSGPAGASLAVRDPRVEVAVLEVARGGLMRRGLAIPQAAACLITNVAADHLGDYGITDLSGLADAKFLLAKAVKPDGRLVLNADDPLLVHRSAGFPGRITWYGLSFDKPSLAGWLGAGEEAAFVADDHLVLARDGKAHPILPVEDFAPGLKGAARYNISNALAAIALASAMGFPVEAMTTALARFRNTPDENPGRGNMLQVGGVSILVDFAHNPHGLKAIVEAVEGVPANRRLFLLGQAGDRRDQDIRDLARIVWQARPDRIIVKELPTKLRGRMLGEVPALIEDELRALAVPEGVSARADAEIAAVRQALEWAEVGDFLVLLLHADRQEALQLLKTMAERNWRPGDPLPG
jgi:UDP-N-acetylmuramyl tripeptide synthase